MDFSSTFFIFAIFIRLYENQAVSLKNAIINSEYKANAIRSCDSKEENYEKKAKNSRNFSDIDWMLTYTLLVYDQKIQSRNLLSA